jgi:hypothetical protein
MMWNLTGGTITTGMDSRFKTKLQSSECLSGMDAPVGDMGSIPEKEMISACGTGKMNLPDQPSWNKPFSPRC